MSRPRPPTSREIAALTYALELSLRQQGVSPLYIPAVFGAAFAISLAALPRELRLEVIEAHLHALHAASSDVMNAPDHGEEKRQ